MKLRMLLTSTLFLFAQMPTPQAQVTVDVSKITCEQVLMEKLAWTEREIELWLSGYYHGKRNDTIVEPEAVKQNEEKLNRYCYEHRERKTWQHVSDQLAKAAKGGDVNDAVVALRLVLLLEQVPCLPL